MIQTDNTGEHLTPELMRAWEERLGAEKTQRAVLIMRSHGWGAGSSPPMWCWAEAFRMVEGHKPEEWGTSSPSLSKELLGIDLFR